MLLELNTRFPLAGWVLTADPEWRRERELTADGKKIIEILSAE